MNSPKHRSNFPIKLLSCIERTEQRTLLYCFEIKLRLLNSPKHRWNFPIKLILEWNRAKMFTLLFWNQNNIRTRLLQFTKTSFKLPYKATLLCRTEQRCLLYCFEIKQHSNWDSWINQNRVETNYPSKLLSCVGRTEHRTLLYHFEIKQHWTWLKLAYKATFFCRTEQRSFIVFKSNKETLRLTKTSLKLYITWKRVSWAERVVASVWRDWTLRSSSWMYLAFLSFERAADCLFAKIL